MSETNFWAANDSKRFLYSPNSPDGTGVSMSTRRARREYPQANIFAFEADTLQVVIGNFIRNLKESLRLAAERGWPE